MTRTPIGGTSAPRTPERPIIPRGVLAATGVLLLFTIALAGTARITGRNHVALPPSAPVKSRDLAFADRSDGGVLVTDAATGRTVALIAPATGGFLRGIMRGLVREHRLNDLARGTSFRLTRWADGRLSIEDPGTGERFELEAFGPTNEASFARLLEDAPAETQGTAQGTAHGTGQTPGTVAEGTQR